MPRARRPLHLFPDNRPPRIDIGERFAAVRANAMIPPDAIVLGETAHGRKAFITRSDITDHVHVMGPPGEGKSKLLEVIARAQIDRDQEAVVVFDPHADLVNALKAYCYSTGQTERVLLVDFSLGEAVLGFNPVRSAGRSVALEARRDLQVLMRVWGQEQLIQTPRLMRWLYATFYALRVAGASYREATDVLDPNPSALGWSIAQCVQQDRVARDLQWLFEDASKTRREERTESAYTRLAHFLDNENIAAMVGQTERVLDVAQAIDERRIVLVNLHTECMDDESARILGTLLFSAFTREAVHRPEAARRPLTIIADGFHRFISNETRDILSGGRKFRCSLILAHQYRDQLVATAGGVVDKSVLEAVRVCARTKVLFGGLQPDEYRAFAEKAAVQTFDPYKVKQEISVKRQLVAGFQSVTTHSSGWSQSTSRGTSTSVPVTTEVVGEGGGGVHTDSASEGDGCSEAEHESFLPVYETFHEVVSREFWGYDQHFLDVLQQLVNQPKQCACLLTRNIPTMFFEVSSVPGVELSPDEIAAHDTQVVQNPLNPYASREEIEREVAARQRRLLAAGSVAEEPLGRRQDPPLPAVPENVRPRTRRLAQRAPAKRRGG